MGNGKLIDDPRKRFAMWKWTNLISFSLMYMTVYIGRYNFNTYLPDIAKELNLGNVIEGLLYTSVFFAYALGCLVNGYFADAFKPKFLIAVGAAGSIFANVALHFSATWQLMLVISILNGYMQSMVWVSGIAILVKWWRRTERGIAVGIANLSSGFSYIVLMNWPGFVFGSSPENWRDGLLLPMCLLGYFTVIFYVTSRENPRDVELPAYEEEKDMQIREEILSTVVPPGLFPAICYFLKNRLLWCWCAISVLSSLCRYGVLTWMPIYYSTAENNLIVFMSNAGISVGMALGTLVIAYIADKYFTDNIGIVVTACAGIGAAIAIISPTFDITIVSVSGMFFTGFFLFGINGLLWLYAINHGTRVYAATIAGILNCFAYFGATLERYFFSAIMKITGDWIFVFVSIDIICIAMVLLGCLICKWEQDKI